MSTEQNAPCSIFLHAKKAPLFAGLFRAHIVKKSDKERAYGAVAVDALDCLRKNGCNGKNGDFVAGGTLFFAYRNGIEKNKLVQNAVLDTLDCRTGKRTMGCAGGYGKSAANFNKGLNDCTFEF